jgi:hypothetical protein
MERQRYFSFLSAEDKSLEHDRALGPHPCEDLMMPERSRLFVAVTMLVLASMVLVR